MNIVLAALVLAALVYTASAFKRHKYVDVEEEDEDDDNDDYEDEGDIYRNILLGRQALPQAPQAEASTTAGLAEFDLIGQAANFWHTIHGDRLDKNDFNKVTKTAGNVGTVLTKELIDFIHEYKR